MTKNPESPFWLVFADEHRPMSMRMVIGTRLAETAPVIIVETPVSICRTGKIPRLNQRVSRIAEAEAGWHYHPLHFPEEIPGFSAFMRNVNCLQLQRELNRIIPDGGKRIACYDSPSQYHLAGKLGESLSVYLAVDDRTRTVWGEPIIGELEAEKRLLGKVDLVVCVSEFLAKTLRGRMPEGHSVPVRVLPNGYDERLFDPDKGWTEPPALASLSSPTILVAGHVSERIDWDGIVAAARLRPEWTWLFLGPADEGLREKIEALNHAGRGQFVWKPPVPREHMPALISHCNACAVPYRLNPFTMSSSPLKAIEYLAMGAPVLSTRIPSLLIYGSVIQWIEEGNGESYARGLDAIASEKCNPGTSVARRIAVSRDSNEELLSKFRLILESEFAGKQARRIA